MIWWKRIERGFILSNNLLLKFKKFFEGIGSESFCRNIFKNMKRNSILKRINWKEKLHLLPAVNKIAFIAQIWRTHTFYLTKKEERTRWKAKIDKILSSNHQFCLNTITISQYKNQNSLKNILKKKKEKNL